MDYETEKIRRDVNRTGKVLRYWYGHPLYIDRDLFELLSDSLSTGEMSYTEAYRYYGCGLAEIAIARDHGIKPYERAQ